MAHVILDPIQGTVPAPNDCGCSEHRSLRAPTAPTINDCTSDLALPSPAAAGEVHTPLSHLRPHPLLRTLPLNEQYLVAFVPSASRIAVLDAAAARLLQRLPLIPPAIGSDERRALAVLARAGLLSVEAEPALPTPPPPTTLVAWLHVTNACNLRCTYCYIQKTNSTMAESTARAAIDTLIASAVRHGFPNLLIKYAGGEPTLQMPLIAATHRYAQQQAARHGIRLHGGVLSNGTLITAAAAHTLRELDLSLMISLDGLGAQNDAQRPTIGGKPSFARISAGLTNAVAAGLHPTVGITVTGQSVAGLPELVEWLLDAEHPFGISFYRATPTGATRDELHIDEQRMIDGMRAAYAVIARRPPRWGLLASLIDRADLSSSHAHSCAAGNNYLVIDHEGRVASCQMRLDQPVTTIGVKDPLSRIRSDPTGLRNVTVDAKEGCRTCDWRYWCGGGCSVATYQATGRYDVKSPNCRIYQELYPDVVRLEGLRLLHWYGPGAEQRDSR